MKRLLFFTMMTLCAANVYGQGVKKVDVSWIDSTRASKNDTLYVINFWATWCKPCVEELPYFKQLAESYSNRKVKVILVNTDMRKDLDTKVKEFMLAKQLTLDVIYINEVNAGLWIDKVNEGWSGAIPATWFLKGDIGFEHFKEGELTLEELKLIVNQVIPNAKE